MLRGINSTMKTLKQVEAIDAICESTYKDLEITEAEYQGKKVKLNDPIRGGSKKFYVYVKNPKGNIVKVSFGDTTGLSIKRDDPARRKAFRARHNCADKKDKTKGNKVNYKTESLEEGQNMVVNIPKNFFETCHNE